MYVCKNGENVWEILNLSGQFRVLHVISVVTVLMFLKDGEKNRKILCYSYNSLLGFDGKKGLSSKFLMHMFYLFKNELKGRKGLFNVLQN